LAVKVPENLKYFIKNGLIDSDDGFEYATELRRILNSDDCQANLSLKEIEKIREFADEVKKIGEFNTYTKDRIKEIENDIFGSKCLKGFLGMDDNKTTKPVWPF